MDKADKIMSTLAWTKADYENAGEEIPDNLLCDDLHTEGELMRREDIDDWIADTYKTFCVLKESHSDRFEKLYDEFVIDVHYLEELGKITTEETEKLLKKENYDI